MSSSPSHIRLRLLLAELAISVSACGAAQQITAAPPGTPSATLAVPAQSSATAIVDTSTPALLISGFPIQSATQVPQPVTVQAASGNMFIRRGPDLAFNPVSTLMQGQDARAMARDVLGDWLQIALPNTLDQTGWISIQTRFTVVSGDIKSLPETEPAYWPVLAFLRNCTHDMLVAEPVGIQIPPVDSFPDNDVRINPGSYAVHDADVDGYPKVLTVEVKEGSAIDLRVDGNGHKRKCPVP